jgi:PAS domain S-box
MTERQDTLLKKADQILSKYKLQLPADFIKDFESLINNFQSHYSELESNNQQINQEYASAVEEYRSTNEELLVSKKDTEDERDKYLQAIVDLNKSQSIAKIGIWKWYVKENRLEWSDEMLRIFGISKETFSGEISQIMEHSIHPDDRARVDEINRIIAETGNKIHIEYRIVLPDGSMKHIWAESGETIRDANHNIVFSSGIVQDITERKLAEAKLQQMTEELRQQAEVMEYAHVLIRDLDNKILYWNKGMEKLYGWSAEEAKGQVTHSFFTTEFPEPIEQYQKTLIDKGVWEGELTHITKNKEKIVVASHHTLYKDAGGEPRLILEVNNDITELKETEKKLRDNEIELKLKNEEFEAIIEELRQTNEELFIAKEKIEERERSLKIKNEEYATINEEYAAINEEYVTTNEELRKTNEELIIAKEIAERNEKSFVTAFMSNPISQSITTLERGIIVAVNEECCRLFEYSQEELLDNKTASLNLWANPEERNNAIDQIFLHSHLRMVETKIKTKSGKTKSVLVSFETIVWKDQPCIISSILDITERKDAEEKLKTSERNLKLFVEYAPAAIAMFDTRMRYIAVSKRFLEDYNISNGIDIIGKSHYEIFPEIGEDWKQIHQRCLAGATEKKDDDRFPRLDGNTDWVRWEIHPWYESKDNIGGVLLFSEVITKRKEAELALKNSEERYRKLAENFPDTTITLYNRDLNVTFTCGKELANTNKKPEDYLGKNFKNIVIPELYETGVSYFQKAFLGETASFESPSFNNRCVYIAVTPLLENDGTINEIQVISQNITDRKAAEEKARERESQFKLLFENAPEPMFIQLNSKFAYVNRATIALYNAGSAEALIGTPLLDRIHPDYKNLATAKLNDLNHKKIPAQNVSLKHLKTDQTPIDVEVTAVPARFDNQDGALVFVKDVTERKRAEEKLKESELRFSTIFHSSPVGASLIHLSTQKIIDVNEAYLKIVGLSRDKIVNHTSKKLNLYVNPEQREKIFEQLSRKGKFRNTEIEIRKSTGEIRIILASAEVIYLSGEAYIVNMMTDITDRKNAEIALKASEEKFRSLFETIQLGITFEDQNGTILLMNKAAENILGASIEEMNNLRRQEAVNAFKEDGTPYSFEEFPSYISFQTGIPLTNFLIQTFNLKTKEKIWLNNSAIPIKNPQTGEQFVYNVIEDISERVKFNKESRKLRTAFAQSSSSFIITDEKGIIEDINHQTEIISGYGRDEIICKSPAIFKSGFHSSDFYKDLWDTITSGNTWEGQICNKHKNGATYWIYSIISPIKDKEGTITHFFATCNDITQQKKDREELNRYREHLENLVEERTMEAETVSSKLLNLIDSMPLGYIETDLSGFITDFNDGAESILGQECLSVMGKPLFSILDFSSEALGMMEQSNEVARVFEQVHYLKDQQRSCRWNVVNLTNHKGDLIGIAYIIEDVTKMKQAEESLHVALEKERELHELKTSFVSMTSHQFRTPLTTILSNSEMLDELLDNLEDTNKERGKRFVKRIYDNIERLELLMSDVLLVGKMQSGKTNFRPQQFKLTDFIKSLISDTNFAYQNDRKINYTAEGNEKEFTGDPQLLSHILNNLLSNAFKYSKNDVGLKIEYLENTVKLSISDQGIGIPKEDQSKLFNSFFRASNTENLTGTGLGLVIVKEYVEMHGGTITFSSIPNTGTTFIVEMPYKVSDNHNTILN